VHVREGQPDPCSAGLGTRVHLDPDRGAAGGQHTTPASPTAAGQHASAPGRNTAAPAARPHSLTSGGV